MAFTDFGKLFKNSFSSFLIMSPESDNSWKEDYRFIDSWGLQQKISPVVQESWTEAPRAPLLGAVSSAPPPPSLVPPPMPLAPRPRGPLSLGINSCFSVEQAAMNITQPGKKMEQTGRMPVSPACPSSFLYKLQEHQV